MKRQGQSSQKARRPEGQPAVVVAQLREGGKTEELRRHAACPEDGGSAVINGITDSFDSITKSAAQERSRDDGRSRRERPACSRLGLRKGHKR